MVSEFTFEGGKYVMMPKEAYHKIFLLVSKNEQSTRLFTFFESS
jgi:hypothetical protein